jgi:hypothetical protein
MTVRHFTIAAAFCAAFIATTMTPASAQAAAGTRLGVPDAVLLTAESALRTGETADVYTIRDRRGRGNRRWGRSGGRRWGGGHRRHNRWGGRRHSRRHYYGYGSPSIQLYVAPPIYSYRAPRYRSNSCDYWADRCAANWGYRNSDYYGCLRYHGCY